MVVPFPVTDMERLAGKIKSVAASSGWRCTGFFSYWNCTLAATPNLPLSALTHWPVGPTSKEFIRIGHQFWIPGGLKASLQNVFKNFFPAESIISKYTMNTSLIWNLNKVQYHSGPNLPNADWSRKGCFITLNRTDVLVLYTKETKVDYDCVYRSTYSFESNQWNHNSNQCFSRLKLPDLFYNPYNTKEKGSFDFKCSSNFDKKSV